MDLEDFIMKWIHFFLLTFVVLTLSSCGKNKFRDYSHDSVNQNSPTSTVSTMRNLNVAKHDYVYPDDTLSQTDTKVEKQEKDISSSSDKISQNIKVRQRKNSSRY